MVAYHWFDLSVVFDFGARRVINQYLSNQITEPF